MGRFAAYLGVAIAGSTFWVIELLLNYRDYAGNNPFGLEDDYQKALLYNRTQLLFSELLFPFGMAVAFLAILVFKLAARSVRTALAFMLFLGMEFWMWRAYVFDVRIKIIYLQNEAKDPMLMLPHYFKEYMVGFGLVFLGILLLKEIAPADDLEHLDEQLKRSIQKMNRGQ